jgi:hypothetical protein
MANCRSGAIRRKNIDHPEKRREDAFPLRKLREIGRWLPLISHESAFGVRCVPASLSLVLARKKSAQL